MGKWKELLLREAQGGNILPLTSRCNLKCVFCSHCQNPPSVETVYLPDLSKADIEEILPFLNPEKKIVIGESVTRICEGEPLVNEEFREILILLRSKFPKTPFQITTNGTLLDAEMISFLTSLTRVEIYLSLNSSNPKVRQDLMGDFKPEVAVGAVRLLAEARIPFHGSIVALPHLSGWDDLTGTVNYLADYGAQTIRIFRPGYTRYAPDKLKFDLKLWDELDFFVRELKSRMKTPVLLEPPQIEDLQAVVEGVLPDSPADLDGVAKGDIILRVGGIPVRSRVEAFYLAQEQVNPRIELFRNEMNMAFLVFKKENTPSGLVMYYDIDPNRFERAIAKVRQKKAKHPMILTSCLAEKVIRKYIALLQLKDIEFTVKPVENRFFGGTISAAGLLTVEDFVCALAEDEQNTDLLLLPSEAFDDKGRDLTGRSYLEIEEISGVETIVV